ncbi:MAG: LytR/AlgR family response regulator transcription factor, partial [Proteocatella sp.]
MLKIAICDDQSQESRVIETILNEYLITNECSAEIRVFNHSDELLKIIENDNFHIYILDIVMPMVNGLELGKEIRKNDREAQIIYVTTEAQFALNAYSVMP